MLFETVAGTICRPTDSIFGATYQDYRGPHVCSLKAAGSVCLRNRPGRASFVGPNGPFAALLVTTAACGRGDGAEKECGDDLSISGFVMDPSTGAGSSMPASWPEEIMSRVFDFVVSIDTIVEGTRTLLVAATTPDGRCVVKVPVAIFTSGSEVERRHEAEVRIYLDTALQALNIIPRLLGILPASASPTSAAPKLCLSDCGVSMYSWFEKCAQEGHQHHQCYTFVRKRALACLRGLHQAGCCHGNLTRDSVVVTGAAGNPVVKLVGFGSCAQNRDREWDAQCEKSELNEAIIESGYAAWGYF